MNIQPNTGKRYLRLFLLVFGGAAACAAGLVWAKKGADVKNDTAHEHTNGLIHATSPYLLQHAHNPVNWHEWGDEAFRRAVEEDKPIFLSIGYAACHWCHVMEHESFEDEAVAAVLNEHFVAIKVDREERPDIDEIYMAFTQAVNNGGGGWPMSVWITPDGTPFHAGTYYPKDALIQILNAVSDTWRNDRERITKGSDWAREYLARWAGAGEPAAGVPSLEAVDEAASKIASFFDSTTGGISGGGTNKFPPSMAMELLLRVYRRTGQGSLHEPVKLTLDHMARGGIVDHVGGGICRYSTDVEWLVPHFEKMLYDQALVSGIYLDALQLGKDPLHAAAAIDILDYVLDDLQSPEGGFYSSRDADSEGLEGKFYIWTVQQVREVLGEEDGRLFCAYYDVTEKGNWFERLGHAPAGPKNILHVTKMPEAFAKLHGVTVSDLQDRLGQWRTKMRAARAKRTPPGLDDKVLTAWNGLMIASLAKAARVLDRPAYAQAAARAADFVLTKMTKNGRLLRTYRSGNARLTGYLSDYAFFIEGLLNLYEATFDRRWLEQAMTLTEAVIEHHYDAEAGGFFFTADDGEALIQRSKQPYSGAIPSGNAVMTMNLLRLAIVFDRKDLKAKAEQTMRLFAGEAQRAPTAFERLLSAADFYHDTVKEIAIVGDPTDPATAALVRTVYERYLPNKVVVHALGTNAGDEAIPLLKGKTRREGRPTAYVCENYRCKLPVTSPQALAEQLGGS